MTDKLEELYQKYNILSDAKGNISKYADVYLECVGGTKGTDKEKKLAAQIISQFFKNFPEHQQGAMNAVLDLCESDELSVRVSAIKVLPILCKDVKENFNRISDILSQLMMICEDTDFTVTCNSLLQVYKENPIKTLKTLFSYIFSTTDIGREKCIQFLYKKFIKMEDKITSEVNDLLVEEGKKILQDSTATEFLTVISFLTNCKLTKTTAGQQELVNAIADRAEIHKDFDLDDKENLNCDRIIMCTEYALPLFSANVESTSFVKFYCEQVLAKWDDIGKLNEGSTLQYQLLKQLAELSTHCGKLETPSTCIVQIFDKLKRFMPLPPEDGDIDKMPNLDFTSVECLLYAFHRLARQSPDFLTADPAVLKDFKARLNYFSRGVGGCKRSLEKIHNKEEVEDEKIKIAPAVLDNINTLIKDLFYTTPIYKCHIQLSFRSLEKVKSLDKIQAPQKRHIPIQFDSSNGSTTKQVRSSKGTENMKLYTPPSGKFSNNFQSYDRPGGRGRGRGGRPMRGMRGSSRGWRN